MDLGGGTGASLEPVAAALGRLEAVRRAAGRTSQTMRADAASGELAGLPADTVTLSYALTMIPDWFRALDCAWSMLRPGGVIGVVDFYVSRKHPAAGRVRHRWPTRTLWPLWFAADNVHLSPDHLPALAWRFETLRLVERRGRLPYLPFRAPYYLFVGRKRVP